MSAHEGQNLEEQGRARKAASLRSALAPIERFLNDESVIEIMLNADGRVWLEQAGAPMSCSDLRITPRDAERMVRSIAGELHIELNHAAPSLSCKLPLWGARVQASIPPIVAAPTFALRKPSSVVMSLEDYLEQGLLTMGQAEALHSAIEARANILIGGGTGSGKTTFANALLREVARTSDRIVIIEDTPELQCTAPNRLEFLVDPATYTWRRAVMDAMRYRPDRIVVGEVRDGAALDLLKAWNTGHPGGIATIHANDTGAMLDRFCQLVEEVLPTAPRTIVAQTIHVCVHMQRDARRRSGRSISAIDRVIGFDESSGWRLTPLLAQ